MCTIDPEALKIASWNSKEYRDKTMDMLLTTMLLVHGRQKFYFDYKEKNHSFTIIFKMAS